MAVLAKILGLFCIIAAVAVGLFAVFWLAGRGPMDADETNGAVGTVFVVGLGCLALMTVGVAAWVVGNISEAADRPNRW